MSLILDPDAILDPDDLPELIVLARRCPRCSSELNLRVTPFLRAHLRDAPPRALVGSVKCRFRNRETCDTIVALRVEDILRDMPRQEPA